jgi:hypothetical protein
VPGRLAEDKNADETTSASPLTASHFSDQLDGVEWNLKRDNNKGLENFIPDYIESLRLTNLSGRSKALIARRYLRLFKQYQEKYHKSKRAHTWSRMLVAIGSIGTTALIAVDSDIADRSRAAQILYYTSFVTSVCVTAINAGSELLQLSRRFYTNATTYNNLQQEGWAFLLLRGRYKTYASHKQCWHLFVRQVEKYHQNASFASLAHIKSSEGNRQGGNQGVSGADLFGIGQSSDPSGRSEGGLSVGQMHERFPWYLINEEAVAKEMQERMEANRDNMPEIVVED